MTIQRYICHSRKVLNIAKRFRWKPGARYTNLRDVRHVERLGFLDINWQDYRFKAHLTAAKATFPELTVAQDVEDVRQLPMVLEQAEELLEYADQVIVVPKDPELADKLLDKIPGKFILGYSVPTRYGGTSISSDAFGNRAVHLLGGRPDHQRQLAEHLNVISLDMNRFTLDAAYGDYFDGETFRPHPIGGYQRCIEASLENINALWIGYRTDGAVSP